MALLERAIYFSVGIGLGFIFGYIAALLRAIKQKVDHMEKEVHEVHVKDITDRKRDKDESGDFWPPTLLSVMLAVVLAISVVASFTTARVNSHLKNTIKCITYYNTQQNRALVTRDEAVRIGTSSEIQLWASYLKFIGVARNGKLTPAQQQQLVVDLVNSITRYRDRLIETQRIRVKYQYNDPNILQVCKKKSEDLND